MYTSIRRYHLVEGSMDDLMHRIDTSFAERISQQPGFASYQAIRVEDDQILTISCFHDAEQAAASAALARRWTEEELGDMRFTPIESVRGRIIVSRAVEEVLEPAHA